MPKITATDKILYELDPLGTATSYTLTREQLATLFEASDLGEIARLKKELDDANEELLEYERDARGLEQDLDDLEEEVQSLRSEMHALEDEIDRLAKE